MDGSRPNLILLCVDDLGATDVGYAGSTFYETPVIDRLAAEGTIFTNAYAGSCMCSPSRASLLTGLTPPRVGVTNWIGAPSAAGPLDGVGFAKGLPDVRTLGGALGDGGYDTWHVGKWHLGKGESGPAGRGFDTVVSGANVGGPLRHFSPYRTPGIANGPRGEFLTDRMTDEAIALVRGRHPQRPFFLNLWPFAVHTPIQAPAPLVRKYLAKRKDLGWGPSAAGIEDIDPSGATGFGRYRELVLMRRRRQSDPEFAAMIENLDTNIGRLMDVLAEEGLDENTVLVFTSDNGGVSSAFHLVPPGCNEPLAEGKGWAYEGGIRVPFFVRAPGRVPPGAVCDTPAIGMDVMPTLLELAGLPLEPAAHRDGRSLAPELRGTTPGTGGAGHPDASPDERDLYWHYPHYQGHGGRPAAAIRRGRWKAVWFFEETAPWLFDLEADSGEDHDLAGEHPGLVRALTSCLEAWLADVGAEVPGPNPRWRSHGRARARIQRRLAEAGNLLLLRRHERRLHHRVR